MSKPSESFRDEILSLMARTRGYLTTVEMAARFDMTDSAIRHHVNRLMESGDVYAIDAVPGSRGRQFALTNPPVQASRELGEIAQRRHVSVWTKPLTGHVERLRAAAELAMTVRR